MRTITLIILYFITGWVYAQEAPKNHATELLQSAEPERLEQIIKRAHSKWGNNKDSVAYEVEKQSYCYIMVYAMIGDESTSSNDQLTIRQTILREVIRTNSDELENVDWFNVYRNIRHKLK